MLSHFHLYGEQRSSGVMGRRNGPSGLRDDDDDDDDDDDYLPLEVCPLIQLESLRER